MKDNNLVVIPYQVRSYQTSKREREAELRAAAASQSLIKSGHIKHLEAESSLAGSAFVVIPYQVRSYQTREFPSEGAHLRAVVIPYQVRSYQTAWLTGIPIKTTQVVIPYQVRSYQTSRASRSSGRS